MKLLKQPWEKYGITEMAYLMAYTQGYQGAFRSPNTTYKHGTVLRKIYNKGRREAKQY